jgi:hypothetical protein
MHNAPSVAYPLGRSRFQGALLLGLWLAGALVTALWWLATPDAAWRFGLSAVTLLAAGMAAGLAWRNSPAGQLRWDGQDWCWESRGYPSGTRVRSLSVALDFQRILLIRLENHDHATLWLWAQRAAMPERWLDLRRAVYSRRKALPAALPPDSPTSVATADSPAHAHPPPN